MPSSTVTQGIGGAWEYRRAGYSLLLNGTWFGRAAWAPWGLREPGARRRPRPRPGPTRNISAGCRATSISMPFQKIHLNAAWFGGHDLDRFVEISVRAVRRHAHSRRAGVGRPLRRARDGARRLLDQHLRAVPLRSVPRSGVGPRRSGPRRLAADLTGFGVAVNLRAPLEYDFPRRARQEPAACALRFAGLDHAPDSVPETAQMTSTLRADLHVHTCHSKVSGTMPFLGSRDCYSAPADVYRVAKARGMDLVAFTDHDSIDGALELLSARPDCDRRDRRRRSVVPVAGGDIAVHLGVYGMTESLHRDVQPLRAQRLRRHRRGCAQADVFFALNHLLHFYRGRFRSIGTCACSTRCPRSRSATATMLAAHNTLVESIARSGGRSAPGAASAWSPAATRTRCGGSARPGRRRRARRATSFWPACARAWGSPAAVHGTPPPLPAMPMASSAAYLGGARRLRSARSPAAAARRPAWRSPARRCRFNSCRWRSR